jgi:hypothetical protein
MKGNILVPSLLQDVIGGPLRDTCLTLTVDQSHGKMEEDVKPEDDDGVDGRGVSGWDGRVCGLGAVGVSLVFGLVRGAGAFAAVLPSFVLVSNMSFT